MTFGSLCSIEKFQIGGEGGPVLESEKEQGRQEKHFGPIYIFNINQVPMQLQD